MGDWKLTNALIQETESGYQFAANDETIRVHENKTMEDSVTGTVRDGILSFQVYTPDQKQLSGEFSGELLTEDHDSEAADVLSFSVDHSQIPGAEINGTTIEVFFSDEMSDDAISAIRFTPTLRISDKATTNLEEGAEVSLSEPVKFMVLADDQINKMFYTIVPARKRRYTFEEEWTLTQHDPNATFPDQYYKLPANSVWETSNAAVYLMNKSMNDTIYYTGAPYQKNLPNLKQCALIQTVNSNGQSGDSAKNILSYPAITMGMLFTGKFAPTRDTPLNSVQLGIPFPAQPKKMRVTFRYVEGDSCYTCSKPDKEWETVKYSKTTVDNYRMVAVLFEADGDEMLSFAQLKKSENVILKAEQTGGEVYWKTTTFSFKPVGGRVYDPTKNYKLGIVFQSSNLGETYGGAPGSSLLIESVEVISH